VVERVAAEAQVGMGKVAQPLRVALTGDSASPGIGTTLVLVGRERTLARIARALAHIESLGAQARQ
jgi:glutamyl-tRNA synthetase